MGLAVLFPGGVSGFRPRHGAGRLFLPGRPWLAPLGIALGQALVAFVRNPTANLLPLGLIVFAVLAAPLVLAGLLGARLRRWRGGA